MLDISNFLKKFSKLDQSSKQKKDNILSIIKNHTSISLNKEDVDIKESGVFLKCIPVFKNEIFLYKDQIEKDFIKNNIFLKIF